MSFLFLPVNLAPTLAIGIFLGVFSSAALGARKVRPMIGIIKEVKGAPDVLRDPKVKVTETLKNRAKKEGFAIVLYKKKYWEGFPLTSGLKIYYGDVLSSGRTSKMVLELQDGFKIIMAKNTKVRLTPRFVDSQSSVGASWLNLLSGKVRAYLLGGRKTAKTGFRSRSMVLGVRGTDFVFEVKGRETKLLTIEGKVAARQVTREEADLYENTAQAYVEQKEDIVEETSQQLKKIEPEPPKEVVRGQKVENKEAPSQDEVKSLEKVLGAEEAAKAIAESQSIEVKNAGKKDLVSVKEITEDIKEIKQDKNEKALDKLLEQTKDSLLTDQSSAKPPMLRKYSFRFGTENVSANQEEKLQFDGGGMSLGVEYRPYRHFFGSLSFVTGTWGSKDSEFGSDLVNLSYHHLALGVGARYLWWDKLSLGFALTYVSSRDLITNSFGILYHYKFEGTVFPRLEIAYNFWKSAEVFLSIGGGEREVAQEELGTGFVQPIKMNHSYFKIGVGWMPAAL